MGRLLKLLTITHCSEKQIRGYIENEDVYAEFRLVDGGMLEYLNIFPKETAPDRYGNVMRFRDYGHFVGVCSKFMPYTVFLENPIEMERLDFKELTGICELYPWFKNNE